MNKIDEKFEIELNAMKYSVHANSLSKDMMPIYQNTDGHKIIIESYMKKN